MASFRVRVNVPIKSVGFFLLWDQAQSSSVNIGAMRCPFWWLWWSTDASYLHWSEERGIMAETWVITPSETFTNISPPSQVIQFNLWLFVLDLHPGWALFSVTALCDWSFRMHDGLIRKIHKCWNHKNQDLAETLAGDYYVNGCNIYYFLLWMWQMGLLHYFGLTLETISCSLKLCPCIFQELNP